MFLVMKNERLDKDFIEGDFDWKKYIAFTEHFPSDSHVEKGLAKSLAALDRAGKTNIISIWTRLAAAAIIILMLSTVGYFYFKDRAEKQFAKSNSQQPQLNYDI